MNEQSSEAMDAICSVKSVEYLKVSFPFRTHVEAVSNVI